MAKASSDSAVKAAATRLRTLLTCLLIFLAAVLVLERFGYAGAYLGGVRPAELARQLLFAIPAIVYLLALWQLRDVAGEIGNGALFGAAAARGLRRVGFCLVGGAALTLAMPWLHLLAGGEAYPRLIDFDVATLVIGGIGLGLAFLARLVDRAGAMQSELDEMF
jgi:hypothetical protein